jgi:hypothetical protein
VQFDVASGFIELDKVAAGGEHLIAHILSSS